MKMIIVTQCCCGCTVRTGSLIIGVVFGIMAIIEFIMEVVLVSSAKEEDEKSTDVHFETKGESIGGAIFSLMVLVACILLIFGTLKERVQFILVWLIVFSVYTVFWLLSIIQLCITVMVHTDHIQRLWAVPAILIVIALFVYSMIVVYSNYRNVKDGVTLPPRTPVVMTV